jgi:hypothetical protein
MSDEPIEDEIGKAVAALEYAAAKRGLYLTVHALKRADLTAAQAAASVAMLVILYDRLDDNLHSHFFHLKYMYGTMAASSIMTSAIG